MIQLFFNGTAILLLLVSAQQSEQANNSLLSKWTETCGAPLIGKAFSDSGQVSSFQQAGWRVISKDKISSNRNFKSSSQPVKEVQLDQLPESQNADINAFRDRQLFLAGYASGFSSTVGADLVVKTTILYNDVLKDKVISTLVLQSKSLGAEGFFKNCKMIELGSSEKTVKDTIDVLGLIFGAGKASNPSKSSTVVSWDSSRSSVDIIKHTSHLDHSSPSNHSISIEYSLSDHVRKKQQK